MGNGTEYERGVFSHSGILGEGEGNQWYDSFELLCFRDSTAEEITTLQGQNNGEFMISSKGEWVKIRITEPIVWETVRANRIKLVDEDEDFYVHRAAIQNAYIVERTTL